MFRNQLMLLSLVTGLSVPAVAGAQSNCTNSGSPLPWVVSEDNETFCFWPMPISNGPGAGFSLQQDAMGNCGYLFSSGLHYNVVLPELSNEVRDDLRERYHIDDEWDLAVLPSIAPPAPAIQMTPAEHVLAALRLIDVGADSGNEFLATVVDYVEDNTRLGVAPYCNVENRGTNPPGATRPFRISLEHLSQDFPVNAASTIVHEARHQDKGHDGGDDCANGTSCDQRFIDDGANTWQVLWLVAFSDWESLTTARFIADVYIDALTLATDRLDGRFVEEPGWRPVDVITNVVILPPGSARLGTADPRQELSAWVFDDGPELRSVGTPFAGATSACFLTKVLGKFQNEEDRVSANVDPATNNWRLEADPSEENDQDMEVAARCIPAASVVTGRRVHTGARGGPNVYDRVLDLPNGDPLGSNDWGCFLSGIGGVFGGGEWWASITGGFGTGMSWNVDAHNPNSDDKQVVAEAVCFPIDASKGAVEFDSTIGDVEDKTRYEIEPFGVVDPAGASRICGFHRIQGYFDGKDEWVRLHPGGTVNGANLGIPTREPVVWEFEKDWGKGDVGGGRGPHATVRCYTTP